MSVLVVDDVDDTRGMYALYMRRLGARVATATSGQAALDCISSSPPDVIVLDLAMPGPLSGWDVIRTLRADPRTANVLIVVVSGQQARDSAMAAGADTYMEKPCLPHELYMALLGVLYDRIRRES